jgi:hypothetical protein
VYDHRDYNQPLQVEPVCSPCNISRGPALSHCNYPKYSYLDILPTPLAGRPTALLAPLSAVA